MAVAYSMLPMHPKDAASDASHAASVLAPMQQQHAVPTPLPELHPSPLLLQQPPPPPPPRLPAPDVHATLNNDLVSAIALLAALLGLGVFVAVGLMSHVHSVGVVRDPSACCNVADRTCSSNSNITASTFAFVSTSSAAVGTNTTRVCWSQVERVETYVVSTLLQWVMPGVGAGYFYAGYTATGTCELVLTLVALVTWARATCVARMGPRAILLCDDSPASLAQGAFQLSMIGMLWYIISVLLFAFAHYT